MAQQEKIKNKALGYTKDKRNIRSRPLLRLKLHTTGRWLKQARIPGIVGGRGAGKAEKGKLIRVGARGSITIPADKVTDLGIGKEDKFAGRKTKAGIALKKV
jgi:hypothetical protein